jgi:hypothetical protein
MSLRRLCPCAFALAGAACSATGDDLPIESSTTSTESTAAGGSGAGTSTGAGGVLLDAGSDGGEQPSIVYANTFLELYRVNPITLEIESLGEFVRESGEAFVPPSGLEDIAIDQHGTMYGIAQEAEPAPHAQLYRIDYSGPQPVCTPIATDVDLHGNGLTFVPEGMLDPDAEVLMASGATWWRIDVGPTDTSADVTVITGLPPEWLSVGGDSVGIIGDAVYTTAQPAGTDEPSHLLTFDAKAGTVQDIGSTGLEAIWGLAYWGGEVYGFDYFGKLHRIDRTTGEATELVLPLDLDWYGAGVTTSAPIMAPK